MKLCIINTCNNKYIAKGYCNKHYIRFQRTGDPLKVKISHNSICSVKECEEKYWAKGYCNIHYERNKRYGDPLIVKYIINRDPLCVIEECDNTHWAKGFCVYHYNSTRIKSREEIERHRQNSSNYYYNNREDLLKSNKQYRKHHPEIALKSNKKCLEKLSKPFDITSKEYKYAQISWSKTIKTRDKQCLICGSKQKLIAHHILYKYKYPESSLDTNNGATFCNLCHYDYHDLNGWKE